MKFKKLGKIIVYVCLKVQKDSDFFIVLKEWTHDSAVGRGAGCERIRFLVLGSGFPPRLARSSFPRDRRIEAKLVREW